MSEIEDAVMRERERCLMEIRFCRGTIPIEQTPFSDGYRMACEDAIKVISNPRPPSP